MINIRCKKCGWRLPFFTRTNIDSVQERGRGDIVCSKCGEVLIRKGGKVKQWF